jgi:hypothetical protein
VTFFENWSDLILPALSPLPTPLLRGEGSIFIIIKYLKLLMTPPSLAGKRVGGEVNRLAKGGYANRKVA